GSLGLDLGTAVDTMLISNQLQRIPTTTNGPIMINGQAKGALLLGRSSAGLRGLIVIPGVIDADFSGNIQIVAYAMQPPVVIPRGSKIAQLVLMDNLAQGMADRQQQVRGDQGFGSTGGLALLTLRLNKRPVVNAVMDNGLQTITLAVLLDSGADVTIVN
ncbi:hypothetical protein N330_13068, partial [Leptosomus discolor]